MLRTYSKKTKILDKVRRCRKEIKNRLEPRVSWFKEILPPQKMTERLNEHKKALQDELKSAKERSLITHDYHQPNDKKSSHPLPLSPAPITKKETKTDKLSIWILNELPLNSEFPPTRLPDWIIKIHQIQPETDKLTGRILKPITHIPASPNPVVSHSAVKDLPSEVTNNAESPETLAWEICDQTPEPVQEVVIGKTRSREIIVRSTPTGKLYKSSTPQSEKKRRSRTKAKFSSRPRGAACKRSLQKQYANFPQRPPKSETEVVQKDDKSECYLEEDPILEFEGYYNFYQKMMSYLESATLSRPITKKTLSECVYQMWLDFSEQQRSSNVVAATVQNYLSSFGDDLDENLAVYLENESYDEDNSIDNRSTCKSPLTNSEEKYLLDSLWPISASNLAYFEDIDLEI